MKLQVGFWHNIARSGTVNHRRKAA